MCMSVSYNKRRWKKNGKKKYACSVKHDYLKAKIIRVTGKAVWNGGSELEVDTAMKYAGTA